MENYKELKKLWDGLMKRNIQMTPFEYENFFDDPLYISDIRNEIDSMNLYSTLIVAINYKHPEAVDFEAIIKHDRMPGEASPKVTFKSLYKPGEDADDIPPDKWHELPEKIGVEGKIIKDIKDHLSIHPYIEQTDTNFNPQELYGELVIKGNLKWAEYKDEKIPYVTTTYDVIKGKSRSAGGLYFVSSDIATEPWQEKAAAFFEMFKQMYGENFQQKKFIELAKSLKKKSGCS